MKNMAKNVILFVLVSLITVNMAFATMYDDRNVGSSGGTGGSMNTYNYVFKTMVSYSGKTIYTYGVHGNITNGSSMYTNWEGWGFISKGAIETEIPSSTVYSQNSHNVSLTTETSHNNFNMYMYSSSTAYGYTHYHSYGSF